MSDHLCHRKVGLILDKLALSGYSMSLIRVTDSLQCNVFIEMYKPPKYLIKAPAVSYSSHGFHCNGI